MLIYISTPKQSVPKDVILVVKNLAATTSLSLADDALRKGQPKVASRYFNDAIRTLDSTGEKPSGWSKLDIIRLGQGISKAIAKS